MQNRLRQAKQKRKIVAEINVVPYIDVMLVLLVIFMVTAPLLTQSIEVELPKVSQEQASITDSNNSVIIASITKDNEYFLNLGEKESAVNLEQMKILVREALNKNTSANVLIRGDKEVNYEQIVDLMVNLQIAGATNVGLLTENIK